MAASTQRDALLVVITGPTASGKTALAIQLAETLHTEIISVDSRQIYRELNIGVARPSPAELKAIPHHFIGIVSINDYYNASMYEMQVLELLETLFEKYRVVLMAGGSGLYIDAVCRGIDDLPTVDPLIRKDLLQQWKEKGLDPLLQKLHQLDPEYYAAADVRNPKRVLKALEVSIQTSRPYSSFLTRNTKERPFRILKIGLQAERERLYKQIDNRVDKMVSEGLVEEAHSLLPWRGLNALNTVGYKELFGYFDGQYDINEAVRLIKRNSRRYAKRQMTWFQRDKEITWVQNNCSEDILSLIKKEGE